MSRSDPSTNRTTDATEVWLFGQCSDREDETASPERRLLSVVERQTAGASEVETEATPDAATDNLRGLITARVDDTNVYDRDGRKLGTLYSVHIDRWSGQVEYAVLSFGGFLGLGQSYHPIPFAMLKVNEDKGGYTVAADRSLLDGSPSYRPDTTPVWDLAYAKRISDYYGMPARGAGG